MKYEIKQQSGMVIVLAILIIAAVLATAVAFGNLIVREIRQTRLIDQSMQAYYFAESGSERALHQVRIREGLIDCSILDVAGPETCNNNGRCDKDNTVPCVSRSGGTLGSWTIDPKKEPETKVFLSEGQSFQVDLFDFNQTSDSGINSIEVDSTLGGLFLLGELTNLSNVLNIPGNCSAPSQEPVIKGFVSLSGNDPAQIGGFAGKSILEECSYIFRLNYPAFNDGTINSTELTIRVYNQSDQVDIPSRLIIDTEATFGDSFQTISVRTPIRPPLSGLYDFVLFSEEALIKENQ